MKSKKPAARVKCGHTAIPIYLQADGTFVFRWYLGTETGRVTRSKLEDAIAEAEQKATQIESGGGRAGNFTAAELENYRHAKAEIGPEDPPLSAIVREWKAAQDVLGGRGSLAAAAKYYAAHFHAEKQVLPAAIILQRLLDSIEDKPAATLGEMRYRRGLRNDLGKFVARFPQLELVTANEIRTYLRELGVGPRRRDNVRDEIVTLFRFAKTKDGGELFAMTAQTEAEVVKRLNVPHAVTTYSPETLGLILRFASPEWMPFFAIGAFAGLRPSEILRLDWKMFKWTEKPDPVIAIPGHVANKTKTPRRAELLPILQRWLADYRHAVGPLYSYRTIKEQKRTEEALSAELARITARIREVTGSHFEWQPDALRHSYGSYRYAQKKSFAAIADWMGNSVQICKKRYFDSKSEEEANAWMSVGPEAASNVVQLSMAMA